MLWTVSNPGSWLFDRATSIVSGVVCTFARRMKMRCGILRSMIRVSVRPWATRVVLFTYGLGFRFRFRFFFVLAVAVVVAGRVVDERMTGAATDAGDPTPERSGDDVFVDGSHAGE